MSQTKPKNPSVSTTAILVAKDHELQTTFKVGAILETIDGDEFILLNHLLDYSRFIDPRRAANGHVKLTIVNKEDFYE